MTLLFGGVEGKKWRFSNSILVLFGISLRIATSFPSHTKYLIVIPKRSEESPEFSRKMT
jgi:hypothetical protein